MSAFGISSDELRSAFTALLPFVPKPTAGPDEPEQDAVILGHLVQGHLVLTVKGPAAYAVAWMALDDWDGELTDFAIHKEDAAMLIQTFRRQDRTVQFRVSHREYRVPPDTPRGADKIMRSTSITVEELGQLFGAAQVSFAGADGRAIEVKGIWGSLALQAQQVDVAGRVSNLTRIPGRVLALTSNAQRVYGDVPVLAITPDRDVLATISDRFAVLFWHEQAETPGYGIATREGWAKQLEAAITTAPDHKIYLD